MKRSLEQRTRASVAAAADQAAAVAKLDEIRGDQTMTPGAVELLGKMLRGPAPADAPKRRRGK